MSIRILLIDDHPLFRKGVAQLVRADEELELVGEVSDGASGIALAAEVDPDLILIDLNMKAMNGIETLRQLKAAGVRGRCVMLTVSDDERDVLDAGVLEHQRSAPGAVEDLDAASVADAQAAAEAVAVGPGRMEVEPQLRHRREEVGRRRPLVVDFAAQHAVLDHPRARRRERVVAGGVAHVPSQMARGRVHKPPDSRLRASA